MFYRRCNLFRAGGGHTNALQYRDVMVLTKEDNRLQDDVTDDAGRVTSPASGFVRALRDAGMPVCVLEGSGRVGGRHRVGGSGSDSGSDSGMTSGSGSGRVVDRAGWERRVADVALSRTDRVTVSGWGCVQGLERRVVVCVGEWSRWVSGSDLHLALPATSRCTTQLITVYPPHPDDTDTDSSDTPHSTDDEDETTEDIKDACDDAGVSHVVSVDVSTTTTTPSSTPADNDSPLDVCVCVCVCGGGGGGGDRIDDDG